MFERVCLIHYHEIGLKGRNRTNFERRLQHNLDLVLDPLPAHAAERIASRLLVAVDDEADLPAVVEAIARVPGVNSVSPAWLTARDMDQIERAALLALRSCGHVETFKIEARRSSTDWPMRSMEMNRRIGAALQHETGLGVRMEEPDVTVRVEVVQGETYVYAEKLPGVGGLPTGTAGTVISLLSAGIDSPVASWRMMRRGAVIVGAHFSGRPHTSGASERLVAEIGSVLARGGGVGRIYVVPFGELQREVSLAVPPDLRVLIYRRLMVRVAEGLASIEKAKALITGESLGQVASQTLENIAAVDEAAHLPVLRPLIGSDKLEIIAEARRIGTYDLSTLDHDDCCTLFMPRTPETHARIAAVLEAEEPIDTEEMVGRALAGLSWVDYACASYRPPARFPVADHDDAPGA